MRATLRRVGLTIEALEQLAEAVRQYLLSHPITGDQCGACTGCRLQRALDHYDKLWRTWR